jgi:hypothetical protein
MPAHTAPAQAAATLTISSTDLAFLERREWPPFAMKEDVMRRLRTIGLWLVVAGLPLAAAAKKPQMREGGTRSQSGERGGSAWLEGWKGPGREAARDMAQKYGKPDEVSETMVIWRNNGPWAHTIVYKEGARHNFPSPHQDLIEQAVELDIPASRVDDIAAFDGSLLVDRTRGLLITRADREAMNFLAVNLAREVARGKRGPEEARKVLTANAIALAEGRSTPLLEKLVFQPDERSGDPGRSTLPRRLQRLSHR